MFTCLTVRAVHSEVAHSLDTDSFINCLQRFISRRGQVKHIRLKCEQLIGAERELKSCIQSWNKSKISDFLQQRETKWLFNLPTAFHMGGMWERQIRSVRKLLLVLTKEQKLNDENLDTFLCVAENIINNRPISPVSDDPEDLEALTPNHK